MRDRAFSLSLLLKDVLNEIVHATNEMENHFYFNSQKKIELLVDNLMQLNILLRNNGEVAELTESIAKGEQEKDKLQKDIELLKQKLQAA